MNYKNRSITVILFSFLFLFNSSITLATTEFDSQPSTNVTQLVEKNSQELASKLLQQRNSDKKNAFAILTQYIQQNPQVYAASFALNPVQNNKTLIKLAPYVHREGKIIKKIDLAQNYDYTAQDWFSIPIKLKKAVWSTPYFDHGGGNAWMITYSIPVYSDKEKKQLIGVITNDVLVNQP